MLDAMEKLGWYGIEYFLMDVVLHVKGSATMS